MNRKTLFELALPNKSIVSDNSCYINEQKKKKICEALKIANFSQHIITFINEFAGISIMVSVDKHLFQSFDIILPRANTVNIRERLEIGRVVCCGQKIPVSFDNLKNSYFLGQNLLNANDEEDLFRYFLSKDSVLPINILPETTQILKNVVRYGDHQNDINILLAHFETSHISITEPQKDFIQEYNNIEGESKSGYHFKININPQSKFINCNTLSDNTLDSMSPINRISLNESISFLRVGEIDDLTVPIWISSDGFLFTDQGNKLGRTIEEAWQTILLD
ncbi:hypothetical protein [Ruminococcus sp.]|uniref:hypothetical protein n=1 Tax=Ruminococcus sp. TaxID=41978 RepID=UPI0025FE07C3|nr:hypothetical protein [Ruminococcus sp.]MBQ6252984.1 hypothetical protein [Ruminococcus sp.]